LETLITSEQIQARIQEMGAQIERDYPGGEGIHLVGVLKGGFMFMADLVRAMSARVTLDFIAVSSYAKSTKSSGEVRMLKDLDAGLEGTVEAATIVSAAFDNLPAPPYAIAYVRLDGVSTAMVNFVRGMDLSDVPAAAARLQPGTRVRVEFVDQPQGKITDFHYVLA